jgi:uncharacterized protein
MADPRPPSSSASDAAPASAKTPEPTRRERRRKLITTSAIGFAAGLINAVVGIGGGILIVPGLVVVRKMNPRVAVATSLGAVLVLSLISLAVHLLTAPFQLDAWGAAMLVVAGAIGSQAGGFLLKRIETRWILFTFAGLTLVSSADLLAVGLNILPPMVPGTVPPLWSYGVMGLVGGVFSGLLGVGGGGLVVLGFSIAFHTPVFEGLPIAQAVNTANSASGVIAQWRSRLVLWKEVWALVPSGLVGIAIGQALAIVMPADTLRVVFAAFFLLISLSLIQKGVRAGKAG